MGSVALPNKKCQAASRVTQQPPSAQNCCLGGKTGLCALQIVATQQPSSGVSFDLGLHVCAADLLIAAQIC